MLGTISQGDGNQSTKFPRLKTTHMLVVSLFVLQYVHVSCGMFAEAEAICLPNWLCLAGNVRV